MSVDFYRIKRPDVRELDVGHVVRIGNNFYRITEKRLWRDRRSFTAAAGKKIDIYFGTTDTNLTATEGDIEVGGYAGNLDLNFLTQFKYIAFENTSPSVELWWVKEHIPLYANVLFNAYNAPKSMPLVLNRWSHSKSQRLHARIDNTGGGSSVTQIIWTEVVEYKVEPLSPGETVTIYAQISPMGFISIPKALT